MKRKSEKWRMALGPAVILGLVFCALSLWPAKNDKGSEVVKDILLAPVPENPTLVQSRLLEDSSPADKTEMAAKVVSADEFKSALDKSWPIRAPQFKSFSAPKQVRLHDPALGAVIKIEYENGAIRFLPDLPVYDAATGKQYPVASLEKGN